MADHADYADNAENESSSAERSARGTPSRRRTAAPSAETDAAQPGAQPADATLDLFGDGPAPEFIGTTQPMSAKVSRAMASPAARRAARQKTPPLSPEQAGDPVEPFFHADAARDDAEAEVANAAPLAGEPAKASAAPVEPEGGAASTAATEPSESAPAPQSGFSYAPTSASGSHAHLTSIVHASDFEAAVHGPVHDHAGEASSSALGAPALAVQARRTKWMLTAAVAALVVTTGIAIIETVMLANFSADAQAQQQRIEVLMQNQQAALDKLTARLDAPPVAPVQSAAPVAVEPAAPVASRAQSASAAARHAARAAKAKSTEKNAEKAASHASAKAHAQQNTRQIAKN
ncbi:hypothetical protein [Paraburkholderia sp. J67]|uniref:hypothetical protein n=1 Tax=Paraburkholderia sp. J67 TaxID=2805435 RepID=UPI002ABE15B7|nr:hypothetical protein [Paraburkholderia sp. J67]